MKTALESTRYENDKFVQDLRSRHKAEMDLIVEENHSLAMHRLTPCTDGHVHTFETMP